MIALTALYNQQPDKTWNATIQEAPHIKVMKAEDLETAKVVLRIITSEEMGYMHKNPRVNWEFIEERVRHHTRVWPCQNEPGVY